MERPASGLGHGHGDAQGAAGRDDHHMLARPCLAVVEIHPEPMQTDHGSSWSRSRTSRTVSPWVKCISGASEYFRSSNDQMATFPCCRSAGSRRCGRAGEARRRDRAVSDRHRPGPSCRPARRPAAHGPGRRIVIHRGVIRLRAVAVRMIRSAMAHIRRREPAGAGAAPAAGRPCPGAAPGSRGRNRGGRSTAPRSCRHGPRRARRSRRRSRRRRS